MRDALAGDVTAETRARLERVLGEVAPQPGDAPNGVHTVESRRELRLVRILQSIATPAAIERLIELSVPAEAARAALREL